MDMQQMCCGNWAVNFYCICDQGRVRGFLSPVESHSTEQEKKVVPKLASPRDRGFRYASALKPKQ